MPAARKLRVFDKVVIDNFEKVNCNVGRKKITKEEYCKVMETYGHGQGYRYQPILKISRQIDLSLGLNNKEKLR